MESHWRMGKRRRGTVSVNISRHTRLHTGARSLTTSQQTNGTFRSLSGSCGTPKRLKPRPRWRTQQRNNKSSTSSKMLTLSTKLLMWMISHTTNWSKNLVASKEKHVCVLMSVRWWYVSVGLIVSWWVMHDMTRIWYGLYYSYIGETIIKGVRLKYRRYCFTSSVYENSFENSPFFSVIFYPFTWFLFRHWKVQLRNDARIGTILMHFHL